MRWSPSPKTFRNDEGAGARCLRQRNDRCGFAIDAGRQRGHMNEPLTASHTVADALKRPLASRVLVNHRMHCVGCAIAPFETLAEACEIYGVAIEDLLQELNAPSAGDDETL